MKYEDSNSPEIAIAPPGSDVTYCTQWVRSHSEFMMMRDSDGHWVLFFLTGSGNVQFESVAFWGVSDQQEAARKMRNWIDAHAERVYCRPSMILTVLEVSLESITVHAE